MIGKNGVSLLIGHNGVQDKTALNAANETVDKGVYDETTLSAVDADLAAGNIADGVTIFGFTGTVVEGILAEDTRGTANVNSGNSIIGGREFGGYNNIQITSGSDYDLVTDTRAYSNSIVTAGFGTGPLRVDSNPSSFKARLFIDGVQMGETGYLYKTGENNEVTMAVVAQRAVNGDVTIKITIHAYATDYVCWEGATLVIGAVKLA